MPRPVIARMWQGRTRAEIADMYATYHFENGVKKLRAIPGNLGVQVLREVRDGVAIFTTLSYWSSLDEIVAYAGNDIEKPRHLPRDAELLLELPTSVRHFEVINDEWNAD